MHGLARELLAVLGMAAAMVVTHMLGLTGLTHLTRLHIQHLRTPWLALDRLLVPLSMVMGLFLLHGLEVTAYAAVYQDVGAIHGWEEALYLSAGAYSTAGWTGVRLSDGWRLLAAFESLTGILLLGWSTAFLFQTLHRILQTEETHPLPEGAIAEEVVEEVAAEPQPEAATAGMASPRPSRSGNGAP
ncbi:MAG: hypothetical protein ACHP7A_03365 [Caulobacterales bacterium]|jgi:hypothetical protein